VTYAYSVFSVSSNSDHHIVVVASYVVKGKSNPYSRSTVDQSTSGRVLIHGVSHPSTRNARMGGAVYVARVFRIVRAANGALLV
jgi:hypothetical protein